MAYIIVLSDDEDAIFRKLTSEMRKVAGPVGPQHTWWDLILEMEEIMEGHHGSWRQFRTAREYINEACSYFVKSGRMVPRF